MKNLLVAAVFLFGCAVETTDDQWEPDPDPWVPPPVCMCAETTSYCTWGGDYGNCEQGIVDLVRQGSCGVILDGNDECGHFEGTTSAVDGDCVVDLDVSGICDDYGADGRGFLTVHVTCPDYGCDHTFDMNF